MWETGQPVCHALNCWPIQDLYGDLLDPKTLIDLMNVARSNWHFSRVLASGSWPWSCSYIKQLQLCCVAAFCTTMPQSCYSLAVTYLRMFLAKSLSPFSARSPLSSGLHRSQDKFGAHWILVVDECHSTWPMLGIASTGYRTQVQTSAHRVWQDCPTVPR